MSRLSVVHFHRHRNDDIRPSYVEAVHLRREDVSSAAPISLIVLTALGKWRRLPERRQLNVVECGEELATRRVDRQSL
jgi:hypothetical protein